MNTRQSRGRYFVEALGQGLVILECFVEGPAHLSLAEICNRVPIKKNTVFRILKTLEEAGYVHQDPVTKRYRLSLKVLDFQSASLAALGYLEHAQPYLEELNAKLGESVNLAVLEGTDIRYVARVAARRIMTVNLHVGAKLPAHATSMGKVLLAALDDGKVRELYAGRLLEAYTPKTIVSVDRLLEELATVRAKGYAVNDEELELGLRSAAVPIRGATGGVVAALNVSTATGRTSREQLLNEMLPELLRTSEAISARLGFRGRTLADGVVR